jgi:hypothetical protein
MIKTKNEAFATFCNLDLNEVKEYRYHYGRTSQAVWAINDEYYCITKGSQKPAVHRDGMEFNWVEVPYTYLNLMDYRVWRSEL